MNLIKRIINKFRKNKNKGFMIVNTIAGPDTSNSVDVNALDTKKLIQRKIDRKRKYLNSKKDDAEIFRNKLVKRVATEYDAKFVGLYQKEIEKTNVNEKNIEKLLMVTDEEAIKAYLDKATIQKLYEYIDRSKKIIKDMKSRNTAYAKKFISRFKIADISNADILANLHAYINSEDLADDNTIDEIVDDINQKPSQGEQLSFLDKID